jgi:hypothetical protein
VAEGGKKRVGTTGGDIGLYETREKIKREKEKRQRRVEG